MDDAQWILESLIYKQFSSISSDLAANSEWDITGVIDKKSQILELSFGSIYLFKSRER